MSRPAINGHFAITISLVWLVTGQGIAENTFGNISNVNTTGSMNIVNLQHVSINVRPDTDWTVGHNSVQLQDLFIAALVKLIKQANFDQSPNPSSTNRSPVIVPLTSTSPPATSTSPSTTTRESKSLKGHPTRGGSIARPFGSQLLNATWPYPLIARGSEHDDERMQVINDYKSPEDDERLG